MSERRKSVIAFLLLILFSCNVYALSPYVQIEPYNENSIPDWAMDLRRAEIVSLGSLPFTTLATSLSFMIYRYAANGFKSDYFPNPLAKSSAAAKLTKDEQIGIFTVSAVLSLAVGVTDYIISSMQHSDDQRLAEEQQEQQKKAVIIEPVSEGDEAE